MTLFDQEYAMERYGDEREAAGMEQGELRKARETAYELQEMGLSADKIARAVKCSLETVQKWLSDKPALVR